MVLTRKTYFKYKVTNKLKVKKIEKDLLKDVNQMEAGVAMLISDKVDFRTRNIIRDKGGDFIMIGDSIPQEVKTVVVHHSIICNDKGMETT